MRVIKPTNKLLEFHPFANVFPLLNGDDFKKFLADIEAHGLSEPVITLYEGKILDGRKQQRYKQVLEGTSNNTRFRRFLP